MDTENVDRFWSSVLIWRNEGSNRKERKGYAKAAKNSLAKIGTLPGLGAAGEIVKSSTAWTKRDKPAPKGAFWNGSNGIAEAMP